MMESPPVLPPDTRVPLHERDLTPAFVSVGRRLASTLRHREIAGPLAGLVLASVVCALAVVARMAWAHTRGGSYLIWNLFLAWLPLGFALVARAGHRSTGGWRVVFWCASAGWLLFFPNAPYICTDVVHLVERVRVHFWIDLSLVMLVAVTGVVLGFVSLYLMQLIVRERFGPWAGWLFVGFVAGLSGVGIYLGRFLRLNSWDLVLQPARLYDGLNQWTANSRADPTHLAFTVSFAGFIFVSYVTLYALTHLPREGSAAADPIHGPARD